MKKVIPDGLEADRVNLIDVTVRMLAQLFLMKKHGVIKEEQWQEVLKLKHYDLTNEEEMESESSQSTSDKLNRSQAIRKFEDLIITSALALASMPFSAEAVEYARQLLLKVILIPPYDMTHG
jgi:hypothetical protein